MLLLAMARINMMCCICRCVLYMVDPVNGSKHKILNKGQKLLLQLQLALNVAFTCVAMPMVKGSFD